MVGSYDDTVTSYDDTVIGIDGEDAIYASTNYVLTLFRIGIGHDFDWVREKYIFDTVYVIIDTPEDVPSVTRELRDLGYNAESLSSLLAQVPTLQRFLEALYPIMSALLAIFLVVVAWSTASAVVAARRAEVGLTPSDRLE